ncbi:nuclear factor of activated T-cells, cytoplasmic 1-like isoform X1, partial [Tachysurus ichikawai]
TSLVVEIPPYRNQRISSAVNVSFYVCNGKRKRSQYQRFTYLPCNGNSSHKLHLYSDSLTLLHLSRL